MYLIRCYGLSTTTDKTTARMHVNSHSGTVYKRAAVSVSDSCGCGLRSVAGDVTPVSGHDLAVRLQ